MRRSILSFISSLLLLALLLGGESLAATTTIQGGTSATTAAVKNSALAGTEAGLVVRCASGCSGGGGAGTQYAEDAAHVSGDTGTMALGVRRDADTSPVSADGDYHALMFDSLGNLKVNIKAGAGSGGTAMVDDAAFTPATTNVTPAGFLFDDVSPDSVNEGDGGVGRMSANRNQYVTIRDAAGNERGLNIDASGNITVNVTGTVTVGSHAVTNAGTFATQAAQSGTWNITNVSGTVSLPTGAATAAKQPALGTAGTASTDVITVQGIASGTPVIVGDGAGALNVICDSGCSGGTQFAEDAAHTTGDSGTMLLGVRNDNGSTTLSGTNGDYTPIATDSAGRVLIGLVAGSVTPGTANVHLGKAEDAVHASGDTGVMLLGVRSDTAAALGANGDYMPPIFDSTGQMFVNCGNCAGGTQYDEDAAETAGGKLSMSGSVRRDTAASSAGTTGDNATINTDATGRLWTNTELPDAAALADATANPTVPGVGSYNMCWNGTTWDRCPTATGGNGTVDTNTTRVTLASDSTGIIAAIGTSVTPGTSAAHLGKAEDAAHTTGDTGVALLTKRTDTAATSAGTDGDYATLNTDSTGRAWVNTELPDAAALADATSNPTLSAVASYNMCFNGSTWDRCSATNTPHFLQSAASTNSTSVKASAGNVAGIYAVNTTATLYYLRLYNLAAGPTCSSATGFLGTIPIPASTSGSGFSFPFPVPISFGTGIAYCLTGGGSSTDNTNAATGVYLTMIYK